MTQDETNIFKNAVLDATEAYLEARLSVADFVKTQIGVVISFVQGQYTLVVPTGNENPSEEGWYVYNKSTHTYSLSTDTYVHDNKDYYSYQNDKKYYHDVSCDNGRVVYNNVLSIGNTAFPEDSVVFLIAPNAQFSNQFILGKLDSTPINIVGGSIDIGNGNFVVSSDGTMNIGHGNFIVNPDGSLNIGNNNFTVSDDGSIVAKEGQIGGFTLDNDYLSALGIIYFRENDIATASTEETYYKTLSSFIPSELGILSDFEVNLDFTVLQSASRNMSVALQRYNTSSNTWYTMQTENLNSTSGATDTINFSHTFTNTDTRSYRILLTINSTTLTTGYEQSIKYSVYTNQITKTALTADGYNGNINSSNGTIGGINFSTGRMSSIDGSGNGFELDNDSFEIRNDYDTYLMYSKSYTYSADGNYITGLFVKTDDTVAKTTLKLFKDTNNYLELDSEGGYFYMVNGSGRGGTLGGSSDKRIKENITLLDNEISKKLIDETNTYKFKYKNIDGYHYGVIAQEVRKTLNKLNEKDSQLEYTIGDTNIKNQRSVHYEEFIPHLINYVKELQSQIDELKSGKEDK